MCAASSSSSGSSRIKYYLIVIKRYTLTRFYLGILYVRYLRGTI